MKNLMSFRLVVTFLALLQMTSPLLAKCKLETLQAQGNTLRILGQTATLGEGSEPSESPVWEGPFRIGNCAFDLAIMQTPFVLANEKLLFVITFSAKDREVSLINPMTCSTEWTSETFFGKVEITPTHLRLGAKRIPLDANCVPIQDPRKKKRPPLVSGAIEAEAQARAEAASRAEAEESQGEGTPQPGH